MPVSTSTEPLPSRSISTRTVDSLVARSTWPTRRRGESSLTESPSVQYFFQCGQERAGLFGRPGGDTQHPGKPDVADQNASIQQRLPDRLAVAASVTALRRAVHAESDEVRVRGNDREAERGQFAHDPVALRLYRVHSTEQRIDVSQRGTRCRLRERGEVV